MDNSKQSPGERSSSTVCFFLVCCYKSGCTHPVCNSHSPTELPLWYSGGPCVSYLPLPIPDPERPWGKADCNDCGGQCHGHFLKPEQAIGSTLSAMRHPPSTLLKEFHQSLKGASPTQAQLLEISKKCLLPINEVEMWLEHLSTIAANRKRGAAKAAETRRRNKQEKQSTESREEMVYCGVCHQPYVEFTDEVELWIQCDICLAWCHFVCVGLDPRDQPPDNFCCDKCQE